FLHCYCDPRALHSFPTRRSCDLVLLDAAQAAGFECAKMGRAELKGKAEPIDLYAVAWSESATQQLIEQVQTQYEKKLKDMKKLRSEEHTSELQSRENLVCRLLLE